MKNEKSPRSDSFNRELYKLFCNNLGKFVFRSINYGYKTGQLSITQKQGIITCIPKGDKPRQFMKNLRPISLLILYINLFGIINHTNKKRGFISKLWYGWFKNVKYQNVYKRFKIIYITQLLNSGHKPKKRPFWEEVFSLYLAWPCFMLQQSKN